MIPEEKNDSNPACFSARNELLQYLIIFGERRPIVLFVLQELFIEGLNKILYFCRYVDTKI